MTKRQPINTTTPQARRIRNEIIHGSFVAEGTLVACALCFPGCSVPVRADESHITALDVSADWMVYGGTSVSPAAAAQGGAVHLFVGMFHGATGMVLDMGTVAGATHCAALCCGRETFVAFVNGPAGGRAIRRDLQGQPFDLLQEWGFSREDFEDLGEVVPGERIVHAVTCGDRSAIVGTTAPSRVAPGDGAAPGHVFVLDPDSGSARVIGEVPAAGRLAPRGQAVFGLEEGPALWRYDAASDELSRRAVALPAEGRWGQASPVWSRVRPGAEEPEVLYLADDDGRLFALRAGDHVEGPLAQTGFAPAGTMAVTSDGRLFGACGEGVARLFRYSPARAELTDIGCAVSVLQRRRYGYVFADAAVGRDGQIYLAEDDDLGHLWIYFPKIEKV